MGVLSDNTIIGASQPSGYEIPYSMYFPDAPSTSPKLSRVATSAGTSNPRWTFATWYKKGRPTTSAKSVWYCRPRSIHAASDLELQISNDNHTELYSGGFRWHLWNGAGASTWDWNTYGNGSGNMNMRDFTDWFHICHIVDYNTSPYIFIYINGILMNPGSIYNTKNGPGYATNAAWLLGDTFFVGSNYSGQAGCAYFADTYFIEDQNLPPIGNFLEVDTLTNQTLAIEYEGTYSGNSFYLDYADSADFGKDVSGLGNHFTSANIPARNQMIDTPQNSVGSNFPTFNPLCYSPNLTFSEGNRKITGANGSNSGNTISTMVPPTTGKWYWEQLTTNIPNTQWPFIGTVDATVFEKVSVWSDNNGRPGESESNGGWKIGADGEYETDGGGTATGGQAFTTGNVVQFALDHDNGALYYGVNNVWYTPTANTGNPTSGASRTGAVMTWTAGTRSFIPAFQNYNASTSIANFGQDSSFAGEKTAQGNSDGNNKGDFYYTPPSGYLALCKDNLGDPTIKLPESHYKTKLYQGNGSTQTITGVGFKPDSTWIHDRSQGNNWVIQPVTTPTKHFISNGTSGEQANTNFLNAFTADGFTLGNNSAVNFNNDYFASFNWLGGDGASNNTDGTVTSSVSANPTAGFSVVTFTGTGSALSVGHGLSQAPDMIIAKSSAGSTNWPMYSTPASSGPSNIMYFNLSNALGTDSGSFTAIDADKITIGTTTDLNQNATQCTLWCFHSVPGYSKIGKAKLMGSSPSGNSGTYIHLGFKPAFFYWKMSTTAHAGTIYDRQLTNDQADPAPHNVGNVYLVPSANYADQKSINPMIGWDYLSNGIKQRQQFSVDTIAYMAFAYWPEKYSRGG